ncbi:hypothetical protein BDW75DRAFT_227197 [Aspergillus navahoensis]
MPDCSSPRWLELKSFRDSNGHHPSQTVVFHHNGSSWWIRVVADWPLPNPVLELGYLKRRSIFQQFIEAIDFARLQLLDNTVTKVALTLNEQTQNSIIIRDGFQTSENYFIAVAHRMCYRIMEDPNRVIAPTVSIVLVDQRKFAYKSIDRLIYVPGDAEHILDEIDALVHFRGEANIAQLIGLVVSSNPYKTRTLTDMPAVITGFLAEYYPGGSLEQIIEKNEIGKTLESLHLSNRTHLDIKPSNIVLDAQKNAILIDISGTGGYGLEWLSPEMDTAVRQNMGMVPTDAPFKERVATDCWAYGRLLSILAAKCGTGGAAEKLGSVALCLTKANPEDRTSLSDALAELHEEGQKAFLSRN